MSGPVSSTTSGSWAAVYDGGRSIQALVELVYCQTANDILTSAMAGLEQALATTQNSLQTLTTLQNLKNSLKPIAKSSFSTNFDYGSGTDDYEKDYSSAASAFFGTPIDPAFYIGNTEITSAGSPGYSGFISSLSQAKSALLTQLTFLSGITDTNDPNTLYAKLKVVYNDLPNLNSFNSVSKWVMDNYDAHGSEAATTAGVFQQHLTDAITAGQSLNSSQQQKVQNYLFVFQQYYQSAAAILNALEQIISRMAQAAGR
jgi:hypothetical protein